MKLNDLLQKPNISDLYRVTFQRQVAATEYIVDNVTDDAGNTAKMTVSKAQEAAEILRKYVTNAININIEQLVVGEFGGDQWIATFTAKAVDVSGFDNVTP